MPLSGRKHSHASNSSKDFMTLLTRINRQRDFLLIVLANMALVFTSLFSAYHASPLFDEPAHFASGIILANHADAGYFKVNPPLNKWITALVAVGMDVELPLLSPSSNYSNSVRPEFETGDKIMELNHDRYARILFYARSIRVPMLLLGSWMLWKATVSWPISRRMLCVAFWCTSPLLLGHGWVVSADGPSGVAMCMILWMTVRLWRDASIVAFALSGLAWGLAIGTKFTFGPLYLFYPVLVHLSAARGWSHSMAAASSQPNTKNRSRFVFILARNWITHALVACLTLNSLYLFHEVGKPIGKHDFTSKSFSSWTAVQPNEGSLMASAKHIIRLLPSPFPKSFLEGVDQQLADMDFPRGAYILGTRIPGEIHWFFLVGYWMKEQVAVWCATLLVILAVAVRWIRKKHSPVKPADDPLVCFSFLNLFVFSLFMANQSNLVWNVRYLIPACPLLYLVLAAGLPRISIVSNQASQPAERDHLAYALIAVIALECSCNFPYYFSYINPFFGGSNRVPIALNDSNFDHGQDLFYIRNWIKERTVGLHRTSNLKSYGLLSGHGRLWLGDLITPASDQIVRRALERKESHALSRLPSRDMKSKNSVGPSEVLIVSRGLTHPEPWAVLYSTYRDASTSSDTRELVQKLLLHRPDGFITPVIAVYFLSDEDDDNVGRLIPN